MLEIWKFSSIVWLTATFYANVSWNGWWVWPNTDVSIKKRNEMKKWRKINMKEFADKVGRGWSSKKCWSNIRMVPVLGMTMVKALGSIDSWWQPDTETTPIRWFLAKRFVPRWTKLGESPKSSSCKITILVHGIVHESIVNRIESYRIVSYLIYKPLKFIYSEKATKFSKIFTLLLSYVVPVKSNVKISQKILAFSEYNNFKNQSQNFSNISQNNSKFL